MNDLGRGNGPPRVRLDRFEALPPAIERHLKVPTASIGVVERHARGATESEP